MYICLIIPFTKYTVQANSHLSQKQLEEKESLDLFYKSQIDKIQLLQETYGCIYYAIGDTNDYPFSYTDESGVDLGLYYDIIAYFKEALNIDFKMVQFEDYQVALEKLEENEIQILTGMLITSEEEPSFYEKNLLSNSKNITFSDRITKNNLILVGRNDKTFSMEAVPNYYWGIEERFSPLVKDTVFEGHTIEYNSYNDLVQAVNGDELQGMLIKESNFNHNVDKLLEKSANTILDYSIPFTERFAYNAENVTLNELLNDLLNIYLEYHNVNDNVSVVNEIDSEDETSKRHVIGITTYVFGLAATVLIIFYASKHITKYVNRRKRIRDLENRLMIKLDADSEKFYIDLKQGKITSSRHFKSMLKKRKRKTLRLKELSVLTGYDYELHYKNIVFLGEELFTEEYALYVDGEKRHFVENGVYSNGFLVTVLTKTN